MVLTCLGSKDSCSSSVAFEVLTRVEMLFKKKKIIIIRVEMLGFVRLELMVKWVLMKGY